MNSVIEFQDVWKIFGSDNAKIKSLNGINLEIKENTMNLILGPSGSGKSTLLNLISLLDLPTNGKILFKGENTTKLSKSERSRIRRYEIGIIYQRDNLFPYLNLLENVTVPMIKRNKEKAVDMLNIVGLTENEFPDKVSILKQQKAALVRGMINKPSLLLADEPTGELNSENTEKMMKLIKDVVSNCTVLIASNNPDLSKYCDNIFSIKDGIIKKKNNLKV